jgi:small-conductance mechanosensitive channel
MILIKQREKCIHSNAPTTLITNITKCLPFDIGGNSVQLLTRMKHMFPERSIDMFLTDRASSWCLFKISNVTMIKNYKKKSTSFGDPYVNQLGQGCNIIIFFFFGPTYYVTNKELPPSNYSKNFYMRCGGA